MQKTKVRLAEELEEVCRDYCQELWAKVLNQAGIHAASEWRKATKIFYPVDIYEVPTTLPPPAALTPSSSKQPSTTLAPLSPIEVPIGPGKAGDQGQEPEVAKGKGASQGGSRPEDKGKGKEVKLSPEAKSPKATLKFKDVVPKAKEVDPKPKEVNPKATNLPVSQPGSKDDPLPAKA